MNLKKIFIADSDESNEPKFEVGEVYNDGEFSGKITEVSSDKIVLESQNEDGDIVNIEVPIDDSLNDEVDSYRAAIDAVPDDIAPILFYDGIYNIPIPKDVNVDEFKSTVESLIDQALEGEEVEVVCDIEGNDLVITTIET